MTLMLGSRTRLGFSKCYTFLDCLFPIEMIQVKMIDFIFNTLKFHDLRASIEMIQVKVIDFIFNTLKVHDLN